MGADARFHADQAGRDIGELVLKLAALELGLEDDGASFVEADQVENVLAPMSMPITAIGALDLAAFDCAGMGVCSWRLIRSSREMGTPPVHPIRRSHLCLHRVAPRR